MTAKLIVIDGPDGAGKTTATGFLKKRLGELKDTIGDTIVVNILSGDKDSALVRSLATSTETTFSSRAELLIYAAMITNTMDNVVRPAIESNINVLIDRGPLSNFCYQLQDINHPWFDIWAKIHSATCADATMLLTANADVGLSRCMDRDGALDKIELRGSVWHRRVAECYEMVFKMINQDQHSSVFSKIAGRAFYCENNTTLEELELKCNEFVEFAFA